MTIEEELAQYKDLCLKQSKQIMILIDHLNDTKYIDEAINKLVELKTLQKTRQPHMGNKSNAG